MLIILLLPELAVSPSCVSRILLQTSTSTAQLCLTNLINILLTVVPQQAPAAEPAQCHLDGRGQASREHVSWQVRVLLITASGSSGSSSSSSEQQRGQAGSGGIDL
jgi:hypothetical protein